MPIFLYEKPLNIYRHFSSTWSSFRDTCIWHIPTSTKMGQSDPRDNSTFIESPQMQKMGTSNGTAQSWRVQEFYVKFSINFQSFLFRDGNGSNMCSFHWERNDLRCIQKWLSVPLETSDYVSNSFIYNINASTYMYIYFWKPILKRYMSY